MDFNSQFSILTRQGYNFTECLEHSKLNPVVHVSQEDPTEHIYTSYVAITTTNFVRIKIYLKQCTKAYETSFNSLKYYRMFHIHKSRRTDGQRTNLNYSLLEAPQGIQQTTVKIVVMLHCIVFYSQAPHY